MREPVVWPPVPYNGTMPGPFQEYEPIACPHCGTTWGREEDWWRVPSAGAGAAPRAGVDRETRRETPIIAPIFAGIFRSRRRGQASVDKATRIRVFLSCATATRNPPLMWRKAPRAGFKSLRVQGASLFPQPKSPDFKLIRAPRSCLGQVRKFAPRCDVFC